MKQFTTIILLATLGFYACQGGNSTKSQKKETKNATYSSDTTHMAFQYPENWSVRSIQGRVGLYEPFEDTADVFEENILMWNEEMPIPLSDSMFGKTATAEIKIQNPGLSITEHGVKKIGDQNFYYFEFNYKNKSGNDYHIDGYTTVNEKRGYNFSCTSEPKNLEEHHKKIEKILSTFKPNN